MIAPSFARDLAVATLACFLLVLAFVMVVNPFGVSPVRLTIPGVNAAKPMRLDRDRHIKPYEVWRDQPKTIFLGTSRIHQSIDPAVFEGSDFAPAYNASVPASELYEVDAQLEQLFALDRNLRHVFLEAFFYNFTRGQPVSVPKGIRDFVADTASLHLSADAVRAAIVTVLANARGQPVGSVAPGGYWIPAAPPRTDMTFDSERFIGNVLRIYRQDPILELQLTAVAALERIAATCRRHGARLHLILTPNYPWDDYRLMSLGYWPTVEKFTAFLAGYEDVTSFALYHPLTTEPAGAGMRWWYDPLHFNRRFGDLIARSLMGREDPDMPTSFRHRLTPSTASTILAERRAGLEDWIAANRDFAEAFEAAKSGRERSESRLFGSVETDRLTIDGKSFPIVARLAGAVEAMDEGRTAVELHGWAGDLVNNKPAVAILGSVGAQLVARIAPNGVRKDIEEGLGAGLRPAGFSLAVPLSTEQQKGAPVVRVFALMADGAAVQLVSALPPGKFASLEPKAAP